MVHTRDHIQRALMLTLTVALLSWGSLRNHQSHREVLPQNCRIPFLTPNLTQSGCENCRRQASLLFPCLEVLEMMNQKENPIMLYPKHSSRAVEEHSTTITTMTKKSGIAEAAIWMLLALNLIPACLGMVVVGPSRTPRRTRVWG